MRAYSMDLRERVLLDSDAGMKAADVAAKYRVSGSWVRLLKQRRRDTGEVAPRVQRHGRRCMLEPHLHTLADLMAAHPDRTLAELKDRHCQLNHVARFFPAKPSPDRPFSRHTSPHPIRRTPAFAADGGARRATNADPQRRDSERRRGLTRTVARGRPT